MYFYAFTSVFLEASNSSVLVVSHKSCVAAFIGTEIVGMRMKYKNNGCRELKIGQRLS